MMHALRQGLRHTAAVPGLLLLLWLVNLLIALPAAVVVGEAIHDSVKWGAAHDQLREGFDTGWYGEFSAGAEGLAATFEPSQIGAGATLDAIEAWWSGGLFKMPLEIIVFGVVFASVWLFLMGGILSRLHRPWASSGFGGVFSEGSKYFSRFLRLGVISGILYYGIFRLSGWLFPWLQEATRDVTSEGRILGFNLVAAALIVGFTAVVKAVFDYAKISMVVGGRRGALLAALHGLEFVVRRPIATAGLVAFFGGATVVLVLLYSWMGPGVTQANPVSILLAIAASQLFLLGRLTLRLGLLGSEVALFESSRSPR